MYEFLKITQLNDFIFCPYSIYLHNVYESLNDRQFHDVPQTKGRQAHETVDKGSYSTKANVITGMMVYSEQYALIGKIDQYFANKDGNGGKLVERKRIIKTIYDGYKLQLYAQYFCLIEMGYQVDKLAFHSLTDNKTYPLPIPNQEITKWFETHLAKLRAYSPAQALEHINPNKCRYCIYRSLCDQTNYTE